MYRRGSGLAQSARRRRTGLAPALVFAAAVAAMPPALAQEARYLTDRLELELVTAPDPAADTAATVAAGTRLTLLDRSGDWAEVRGPAGEQGWLPSALLVTSPPVAARIEQYRGTIPWPWVVGAVVVALALGFIAGYLWLDAAIRRKHGGFRIY